MKLLLKLLFGLVIIPGAVFALLWHLNRHGFFDLDRIEVVLIDAPAKSLYLKPLVETLDQSLEMYRGKSLWTLDLVDISRKIQGLNWVDVHSMSRSWPSGLVVKIRPQEVKALYVGRNNRFFPVIREGKMLDPVDAILAPDVTLLDGEEFIAKPELRRKAVEMIDEIPQEGMFSRKTISELRWDVKSGFRARMTKTAVDVRLGEDQIALKSARVSQVLEYLSNRGMNARQLDANFSKKVLVKLETPASGASSTREPLVIENPVRVE